MVLSKRRVCADDQPFLFELYCSVRDGEGFLGGLEVQQLSALLKMQFDARERTYHYRYPDGDHQIILLDEKPIGRIFVHRNDQEIRLTDIALLTEYRGKGIGAGLIKELLQEADLVGKPVTLHVEMQNPAIRLYHRLGFEQKSDDGAYLLMERLASQQGASGAKDT